MVDGISEEIEKTCNDTDDVLQQRVEEIDSLAADAGDIENEKDEAVAEVEEMQGKAEWDRMVDQFWYYCGRTKT
jgi:uncharacterized protein Yka (UPF0111/DUF47 family)